MFDHIRVHFFTSMAAGALSLVNLGGGTANAHAQAPADEVSAQTKYLRVIEKENESLTLEVGAWTFRPAEGEGPTVALVSVAHIGDAILYRRLQHLLGRYDLVLYESVKPAGAGTPVGRDDAERAVATGVALKFLAQMTEKYRAHVDAYPASTSDLLVMLGAIDGRLSQWAGEALVDAWGNPVRYERVEADDDQENGTGGYIYRSFGSDGEPGGTGHAADILIDHRTAVEPLDMSGGEDNLQQQLAEALGMAFQLDAMDYSGAHWRCSDMTIDQLSRAFSARGLDFGEFGGALAGTSMPARIVKLLLQFIRMLDAAADGMMSDTVKIVMIEMLGDANLTETALQTQFGAGFAEVIIGERNQVVMDDLRRILDEEPEFESIAIFYGAAHMPDFETRLRDQFNYVPHEVEWVAAMRVNLRDTAVRPGTVNQIRRMIRLNLGAGR